APAITRITPPVAQPGDVVTIAGSGFGTNPALLNVRFGPNRAPALTATATQITVQVPTGQPLGPTQVTVSSSNSLSFVAAARSKIPLVPNPPARCGFCACRCDTCRKDLSPCPAFFSDLGAPAGGNGGGGSIYGDRGELYQTVTDLSIAGR